MENSECPANMHIVLATNDAGEFNQFWLAI